MLNDSSKKPDSIVCASMQSSVDGSITYGGKDLNGDFVVPNGNPQKISLINGNMVLIPKSVFKKVGMLDPIFPHSLGDFEYGMRAAKQNIESYTASNYGGICDSHDTLPKWCIGSTPLAKRFKSFRITSYNVCYTKLLRKKRELLFKNPDILPEFESLTVIKAVQSLGGDSHGFSDWFEALEYMKAEIDKVDYDA